MTTADECRQYAAECLRLAQLAPDPADKARLLQMAQAWRDRAEKLAANDPTAAPPSKPDR